MLKAKDNKYKTKLKKTFIKNNTTLITKYKQTKVDVIIKN